MLQASSLRSGALNNRPASQTLHKRADSRAAIPGVKVNAITDSDESSSIERPLTGGAYAAGNSVVKSICENLGYHGQVAAVMALPGDDFFPSWRAGAKPISAACFRARSHLCRAKEIG